MLVKEIHILNVSFYKKLLSIIIYAQKVVEYKFLLLTSLEKDLILNLILNL